MPDNLKAELKISSEPGPNPYVIVIPIRKNADWWSLPQEQRAAMMQEHTEASLPYSRRSNGSSITPAGSMIWISSPILKRRKLEDFHSLVLALEKVKEFQHNRRFGHPILLGTVTILGRDHRGVGSVNVTAVEA